MDKPGLFMSRLIGSKGEEVGVVNGGVASLGP